MTFFKSGDVKRRRRRRRRRHQRRNPLQKKIPLFEKTGAKGSKGKSLS